MTDFVIQDATIQQAKARIAFIGPSGAGKTYTALTTAQELGKNILVIDTENGTSAKYSDRFQFKILKLTNYSIKTYIEALEFAADKGFDVVIVDSLSHAWAGPGGALEQAELASAKYGGNKFAGWKDVTPLQNKLIHTILTYPTHLIATLRMKIEYALVDDGGKSKPQKLGLGIIQRDSFEYEFDVIGQMDVDHNLTVTKTRCFELDGFMANKPDGQLGQKINSWLNTGEAPPFWPDGWFPAKNEFFNKIKSQWPQWDNEGIIGILKPKFGEFTSLKAASMWKLLEEHAASESKQSKLDDHSDIEGDNQ